MYKIREFSYLCQTTLKTLRYYDKIDLLKPCMTDQFTGYRYYDDSQLVIYQQIANLKKANFSLKEIKEILANKDPHIIEEQLVKISNEQKEKEKILKDFKNELENSKSLSSKLVANQQMSFIGKYVKIKSRSEIKKYLNIIDKKIHFKEISKEPYVFINLEKGYKDENILCFIGRMLPNRYKGYYKYISDLYQKGLEVYCDNKPETMLYIKGQEDISRLYKKLITYSSKNNIQIRGEYQEIYHDDFKEIYVESYDLNIENTDTIIYRKKKLENLQNIYPKEFVGTWELKGEITEPSKLFNPKRKHHMPNTILKELILLPDGTTNFPHILWKENFLIIKEGDITIFDPLYLKKDKNYLEILINQKETNARPYCYYYKRKK